VLGRIGVHRLEQLLRLAAAIGLRRQHLAGRVQPLGEVVAQRLERAEVEQPRALTGRNGDIDGVVRERRDQRVGELALEPGDLPAKGTPGGDLVDLWYDDVPEPQRVVGDQDHEGDSTPDRPR
jgi:hypothetical protein